MLVRALASARPLHTAFLVLLSGLLVLVLVYRSWVENQARAITVLSTTIDTPGLTWFVKAVTGDPRVAEQPVAGVPATIVRPAGEDPWPAVVFVNGATRRGRRHPDVQRLARGLGRAGYLVVVPDLPGLRLGEITDETVAAAVRVARATANRADAKDGRVAFMGVSVGTTLALLAAQRPPLAERVSVVAGIAPFTDLRKVARLATTGVYPVGRRTVRYTARDYLSLAVARSLAAGLPPGRDRRRLLAELEAVDDDAENPLSILRDGTPSRLGRRARAVVRLLANRDPHRFERLYAALPRATKDGIERLSPVRRARRLTAPVELATAPRDDYFPVAESRALARRAPDVRLTVTRTLEHAIPAPSLADVADLFRFDAFVVRVLAKAR